MIITDKKNVIFKNDCNKILNLQMNQILALNNPEVLDMFLSKTNK